MRQNSGMDEPDYEPMRTLTSAGDLTVARLLAARLQAEGIPAVVRGEPMGPYPVTVGRMAVTEVLVPENELEAARQILEEIEAAAGDIEVEPAGVGKSPNMRFSVLWWVVAAALLGALIWIRIGSYL